MGRHEYEIKFKLTTYNKQIDIKNNEKIDRAFRKMVNELGIEDGFIYKTRITKLNVVWSNLFSKFIRFKQKIRGIFK